ncbi:hypothetical protein KRP22_004024 [Phytophthora ramorum]|nr:Secreted RxLR effector protein [Phytophthora ramorum]
MRLLHVLSAVVVTLLAIASTNVAGQAKWGGVLMTDRNGASSGRSLRVHTNAAEERANLLSKIGKNLLVTWWLEIGKNEAYVMEALKLKGLSGSALIKHKNYKYLLKYVDKAERMKLTTWYYTKQFSTYQAWTKLGMQEVRTVEQLNRIKKSDSFRIYKRYVNLFDDAVLRSWKAGYNPPVVMVARGASEAEVTARVQIMAQSKRSEEYAKVALGMTVPGKPMVTLKGEALKSHDDYNYFDVFQKAVAKIAAKAAARKEAAIAAAGKTN